MSSAECVVTLVGRCASQWSPSHKIGFKLLDFCPKTQGVDLKRVIVGSFPVIGSIVLISELFYRVIRSLPPNERPRVIRHIPLLSLFHGAPILMARILTKTKLTHRIGSQILRFFPDGKTWSTRVLFLECVVLTGNILLALETLVDLGEALRLRAERKKQEEMLRSYRVKEHWGENHPTVPFEKADPVSLQLFVKQQKDQVLVTFWKAMQDDVAYIQDEKVRDLAKNFPQNESLETQAQFVRALFQNPLFRKNLTHLSYVRNKGIQEVPEEISFLTSLTCLDLSDNQLRTLPAGIGALHSLYELYLQSNHLTSVPPELGTLQSLNLLCLEYNQLRSLPESFARLKSLEVLWLTGNRFSNIPESITNLPLTILSMSPQAKEKFGERAGRLVYCEKLRVYGT